MNFFFFHICIFFPISLNLSRIQKKQKEEKEEGKKEEGKRRGEKSERKKWNDKTMKIKKKQED